MPRTKYCWDSGVFIAMLQEERWRGADFDALLEVIDAFDRGQVSLVTCGTAVSEVIGDITSPHIPELFDLLTQRPGFTMSYPGPAIVERVRRLRLEARAEGRRLKTPDCNFIATAILLRCDALHSFDDQLLALSESDSWIGLLSPSRAQSRPCSPCNPPDLVRPSSPRDRLKGSLQLAEPRDSPRRQLRSRLQLCS
jgi:predicted nucleic acid-binding protein